MKTMARIWTQWVTTEARNAWRRRRGVGGAWAALLIGTGVAYAQNGSLQGRVTDIQDQPLVGVTVTIRSPALGTPLVLITDTTGTYQTSPLAAGDYTVDVTLVGFQTVRETVSLGDASSATLDIQLDIAALTERVNVVGVTPLLGATIGRER
ncbi:MAG: carboxypeptidase-like regulatory domain-containing protein, partial [Acidobacteriota bacterium]|nr:carboxypeptidase-like regulatory domain-containing protein [Acidobacteriota bacterium]